MHVSSNVVTLAGRKTNAVSDVHRHHLATTVVTAVPPRARVPKTVRDGVAEANPPPVSTNAWLTGAPMNNVKCDVTERVRTHAWNDVLMLVAPANNAKRAVNEVPSMNVS